MQEKMAETCKKEVGCDIIDASHISYKSGETMKNKLCLIKNCIKRNLFLYTLILSLLVPDIVLRAQSSAYAIGAVSMVPTLFSAFWVLLFTLIFTGFLSKKWGRIFYMVLAVLMSVFMISNYIYFRIFNQFYWLDSIGMTGQAMAYSTYIVRLLDWKLILIILLQTGLIVVTFRTWREKPYRISGLWLILPMIVLLTVHTVMMTKAVPGATPQQQTEREWAKGFYNDFTDSNRSMQTAGAYQYVMRNVFRMVFPEAEFDRETVTVADEYFSEKAVWPDNDKTGLFAGKNVIMVMMESIDDWMVNETYMPTVSYMMQNGMDFSNHFACTFGTGYTFNTEFTVNTGYHAMAVGTPASSLVENAYPYSLARQFAEKGYTPRSFHFNTPDFYNRGEIHKTFGYEEYISYQDYMPMDKAQCDGIAIGNKKLYRAMAPKQENPFFHFVITYSAHLPYNDEDMKVQMLKKRYPELVDKSMDTEINNALIMAHDTDEFFRTLLENLEKDGLLDNTVIIGFSDHFAYGLSDWEKMYNFGEVAAPNMLERAPFFIYSKGMEPMKVEKVTNSLDVLPTIINLFGLTKTKYWVGEDAFDPSYGGYVYFSNGSWYDGKLYYVAENYVNNYPIPVSGYVSQMNEMFYIREKVNEAVIRTDYFGKE